MESVNQLSILLAEDNLTNRFVIERMFKKLGYAIETVEDGEQAVQHACSKSFDLIFMDIQMPYLDGLQATKEILDWHNARNKALPVIIALTADAMQEDEQRCLQAGMSDYISKPVAFEKLSAILHKWTNHA